VALFITSYIQFNFIFT